MGVDDFGVVNSFFYVQKSIFKLHTPESFPAAIQQPGDISGASLRRDLITAAVHDDCQSAP